MLRNVTTPAIALLCAAILIPACTPRGRGSSKNKSAAAEALTHALQFQNENAKLIDGELPEASEGAPRVMPNGAEGSLGPGATGAVDLAVEDVDPEDPIVSTLIYFDGASQFVSVPGAAVDGTVSNPFTVSQDVCDNLCDIIHQVKCYEAAMTESGLVTAANLRTVVLECEGAGNPSQCSSAPVNPTGSDATTVAGNDTTSPGPDVSQPPTGSTAEVCATWCGFVACTGEMGSGDCQSQCNEGFAELPPACQSAMQAGANCLAGKGCNEQAVQSCVESLSTISSACAGAVPR